MWLYVKVIVVNFVVDKYIHINKLCEVTTWCLIAGRSHQQKEDMIKKRNLKENERHSPRDADMLKDMQCILIIIPFRYTNLNVFTQHLRQDLYSPHNKEY